MFKLQSEGFSCCSCPQLQFTQSLIGPSGWLGGVPWVNPVTSAPASWKRRAMA